MGEPLSRTRPKVLITLIRLYGLRAEKGFMLLNFIGQEQRYG